MMTDYLLICYPLERVHSSYLQRQYWSESASDYFSGTYPLSRGDNAKLRTCDASVVSRLEDKNQHILCGYGRRDIPSKDLFIASAAKISFVSLSC